MSGRLPFEVRLSAGDRRHLRCAGVAAHCESRPGGPGDAPAACGVQNVDVARRVCLEVDAMSQAQAILRATRRTAVEVAPQGASEWLVESMVIFDGSPRALRSSDQIVRYRQTELSTPPRVRDQGGSVLDLYARSRGCRSAPDDYVISADEKTRSRQSPTAIRTSLLPESTFSS
jgi:hypothetical protein